MFNELSLSLHFLQSVRFAHWNAFILDELRKTTETDIVTFLNARCLAMTSITPAGFSASGCVRYLLVKNPRGDLFFNLSKTSFFLEC